MFHMLFEKTGIISKKSRFASSREIAGEFHRLPTLIENTAYVAASRLCRLSEFYPNRAL